MAASSSSHRCRYHAFLSFRGADTRKGFTDHLYRALELAGVHTFRDDDEIERGAEIAAELHKAIQESQVAIIVFSKDYASSSWCLDELAMIMDRKRADGYMVVPVFYKVDPSDVRKQTGSFAEAFVKHEKRFQEEMSKVEKWRKTLKDVAELGGIVLGDQYESHLIQNLVEDIGNKLESKVLNVAPHLVGIDYRVKRINMWLRDGSTDVGVAGIYGMGGVGKTTIAKAAYNMNLCYFQGSSFLADIGPTLEQPNGLVRLQMKLLFDIQKRKPKKIYSVDEGISRIKHIVSCKSVLIVLDDVNDSDQFSAILGMPEWFHPGSKIIITTRNHHLLVTNGISEMFTIQKLHEQESLELFSWHAFRQAHPIKSYVELSTAAVQHCGGLPLAIQVLGSSLFGKSVDVWKDATKRLDVIPNGKVQKVLRISLDTLPDDDDRSLFLHIACFFTRKKKSFAITVLDNLEFCTRIGIENLVDRCLVQIDHDRLTVHQLLIDMARQIIREESPENPGKRSRVWHKDASSVLENISGTETIKGLMLSLPKEDVLSNTVFKSTNKRFCADEYDAICSRRRRLGLSSWISNNFSSTKLDSDKPNFKIEAFKGMPNLQLLLLNNVQFSGTCDEFPKNLSWLSWQGFHWESIPKEFPLGNLVALELQNSNLQFVWQGTKRLPKLKILDLSHSLGLVTTPDLSGLSNLERLVFEGCKNITEIDESISGLEKLVFLNLQDCKNLVKLPKTIYRLRSIQELNLSGCSSLSLHANAATDTKNFFSLLSYTSLQSIWSRVSPRRSVEPTSFSLVNLPHCLVRLNLSRCNLSEISIDLGILSSLKELDLSYNPFMSLPENMKSLIVLDSLQLHHCSNLTMLPELPSSLNKLDAAWCTSVKKVTNLPNIFTRLFIDFFRCRELVELHTFFIIKPLINQLHLEMIRNMGLCNLEPSDITQKLEMKNCLTHCSTRRPLQGLYEFGIFSIFLGGRKIPDWYNYRGETALSIVVPSHPKLKITGLNACVVYTGGCHIWTNSLILKVSNEANGLMWSYSPVITGLPKVHEEMSWLSHWQFVNDELEGGEELRISVDTLAEYDPYVIKGLAVQVVYEHQNEGNAHIRLSNPEDVATQHEAPYWSQGVLIGNVSPPDYQIWPGTYLLCNHYLFRGHVHFSVADPTGLQSICEHQDFEKHVLGQQNLSWPVCGTTKSLMLPPSLASTIAGRDPGDEDVFSYPKAIALEALSGGDLNRRLENEINLALGRLKRRIFASVVSKTRSDEWGSQKRRHLNLSLQIKRSDESK